MQYSIEDLKKIDSANGTKQSLVCKSSAMAKISATDGSGHQTDTRAVRERQ